MKKTFKLSFRDRFFALALAFIFIIPLVQVINILYIEGLSLVALMVPLLLFIILYYFSGLTYRVIIKNGVVSEWDMLHRSRYLKIEDIQYVRPKSYKRFYLIIGVHGPRTTTEAPEFINEKFKKRFPRYAISQDAAVFLKDNYEKGAF